MPRDYAWRDLVGGVLAVIGVVGAALSVLIFARVGALRGDKYTLYAPVGEARGVIVGTDVWIAGQRAGQVKRIVFQPPTADTNRRLVLELDMLEEYKTLVRRDSYAQIRSGGSLIGAPVVYVTVGTEGQPALGNRAMLASRPQVDAEGFASDVAITTRELPEIIRNVRAISTKARALSEAAGALTGDERAVQLDMVSGRAARLTRRATAGGGTVALLLTDERMLDRATRAVARADSLMRLVGAEGTTIARVRGDSALQRAIADARNEISIVSARLARADGTAGRMVADSAILRELARFQRELGAIMQDVKKDPGRYIAF